MLAKKVLAYPEMLCYNERAVYKNETRLNGLQADVYHEIKEVRENERRNPSEVLSGEGCMQLWK